MDKFIMDAKIQETGNYIMSLIKSAYGLSDADLNWIHRNCDDVVIAGLVNKTLSKDEVALILTGNGK